MHRSFQEISDLYNSPLLELVSRAHGVRRENHPVQKVQLCTLISIKTGGCTEDCKYCAQSARYSTAVRAEPMMTIDQVRQLAQEAKARGATRVCLGAAWRKIRGISVFERILEMVRTVKELGVEVCCTLGTLSLAEAEQLKNAGLYAYNHNIDTSREFYPSIITTRTFDERLQTLEHVKCAGLKVCCGGILGLGESREDRISFLATLSAIAPESLPINLLSPVRGTPLEDATPVPFWELLRTIATARILLPKTMLRLSCGRATLNAEQQTLALMAGINSIFLGEKLLTVANNPLESDAELFTLLGLEGRAPYES